ncbi:hypothetical protein GCM10010946_00980 [Undibacterium squillarum]|uniref:Uncharacterized protein n=1 Tax=Undibacterium squillarum TaxID=1131567 RepID=A0ABQ2XR57_9BURK|nr:hypothetical protein GCM10010946_00980 [Undibacterium squillarum]
MGRAHCNAPIGSDTELRLKKRITAVGSDLYANIVISISRKARLSADDSQIAVLNTAFEAFLRVLRVPRWI